MAQIGREQMSKQRILIVEDEPPIREMVVFGLSRAGFDTAEAGDSKQARVAIADSLPDLILMDWMLPDVSGLELLRRLKRDDLTRNIPVIMLTARADEYDKVSGLESGADDYLTKPFSQRELLARINAVLRRSAPEAQADLLQVKGLSMDEAGHRVMAGDEEILVGPTEYKLLRFFMTHPDRVYSRSQLLDRVWGENVYVEERTVDVHIRRLRKALESSSLETYVQTVRGAGYRFSAPGA
jgi:two-component system phosphate regulon response regulator PhoB